MQILRDHSALRFRYVMNFGLLIAMFFPFLEHYAILQSSSPKRYQLFNNCVFLFSLQALNGFLMMATQTGKLLYISDNAAEYLGHSMVSVYYHTPG